jgi:hypothetical protein
MGKTHARRNRLNTFSSPFDFQRVCLGLSLFGFNICLEDNLSVGYNDLKKQFTLTKGYFRGLSNIEAVVKKHGLPHARQRRKRNAELASALRVYNHHLSPLHRLPWELVLQIANHMSSVDYFAFRMSCQRHAFLADYPDAFINSSAEQKKFPTPSWT